ncbi:serine/threonine-protein kinase MARK2-like [Equus caballus]|uniref:serine/threonine-protein kinase MARK2-like n=1 Tax=Equus caballus TaxID=9796 RepID=UPI0038B26133
MLPGLAATSAGRQPCPRDYQLRRTLGEGSFGIVKLALHVPSGTEVAVKIIQKKEQSAATAKRLLCETQGLARLRHPHILRLVEVMESKETLFIISEYVRGGNLLDHLMEHGPLTEEEARGWFRQLVSALQYCHRRGVIHRDLKPENVLLDPAGSAKLADFGFCSLDRGGPLSTFCGTPGYMAPEVMRLQPYDGPPADVWSLGVLLHAMLAGSLPFWGEDFEAIQRSTLRGAYSPPRLVSCQCAQLLRGLLTLDPGKRKTLEEVMGDPWVNWGQPRLRPYREPPADTRTAWGTDEMAKAQQPQGGGHARPLSSLPSNKAHSCRALQHCTAWRRASEPRGQRAGSEPVLPTWLREAGRQRPSEKPQSGPKAAEPGGALPSLDSCPAAPSPAPPWDPGAVPSSDSARTTRGAQEESCQGDSRQAGQPHEVTPASPSGRSQGRGGAARRLFKALRRLCCCLPIRIGSGKRNRVWPR